MVINPFLDYRWSTARSASSAEVSAKISATPTAALAATPAAVTAASSMLPSSAPGPASGSAPGAGLLLGSLGQLGVEPLELLHRGGLNLGVPELNGLLSRRGFADSPHEGALFYVGHEAHVGLDGGLGPVVDHAPAPVHAQELHRRVLEQRWELLESLINPGSNVSNGGGKKLAVFALAVFALHTMVFKWGQSAALLECEFLVLRVGDIHFLIDEEIRVPLWAMR